MCADGALLCYDRALTCDVPVDDADSAAGGTRKNKKQRRSAARKREEASRENGGQQQAVKVGRKAELCRLLTNLSLVEHNLGNHESSFYFSALALGLGHNRSKALFRHGCHARWL